MLKHLLVGAVGLSSLALADSRRHEARPVAPPPMPAVVMPAVVPPPPPVTGVPLPAAGALMLAGIAGLGGLSVRRKRSKGAV